MQQQDEPQPGEQQQQEQQQQPHATAVADTPQRVQRPDECGVCLFVYDEVDRRPRTLPCGHTYCSLCVCVLLEDGHLNCPSCRTDHRAPEVNHFPINYGMEALAKALQHVETAFQASGAALQATGEVIQVTPRSSQATGAKIKQRAAAGLSRKLWSMVQEQKGSLEGIETTVQKEVQQLSQYRAKLAVSRREHARLLKDLDKVVQWHQASMDQLQEEDVRVEGFVAEGEEAQQELRAAQGQLDQINTAQEAFTTIDVADHTIAEVEEWLQHSREEVPNGTVLINSFRVLEATKAALKAITEETKSTPDQATSGHSNCTIMEAVENIEEGPVQLMGLHTERLRKKVAAGQVFATQKYKDGTCYSSKVIYEEDKMYLHALKDESPPQRTFTFQVSKALENIKYPDISVFLDLARSGTLPQRVHIKLAADTPLTRQFVTLCLGHTGLTYCNTNLSSWGLYRYRSIVWGGDISGQEAAGKQVLPSIQGNECTVDISPGMVVAWTDLSDAAKRTQFGIVLNYHDFYRDNPSVYLLGSVDADGLSVVQTAANKNRHNLNQVRVVDCGVVV